MRAALQSVLSQDLRLDLVAPARTCAEAIEVCRTHHPQLIVCDMRLPDGSGAEVAAAAKPSGAVVVVLSGHDDDVLIVAALQAGARGYVSKSVEPEELLNRLHQALAGDVVFDQPILQRIHAIVSAVTPSMVDAAVLSEREREVLTLLAEGMTVTQIAHRSHLSSSTVKTHVQHIYAKLGVNDRMAAVAKGTALGLIGERRAQV